MARTNTPKFYNRTVTGTERCPGEAHKNPNIDYCLVCINHSWGKVPTLAPVDFQAARTAGLEVRGPDIEEAQIDEALALVKAGTARWVDRTIKTQSGKAHIRALAFA